MTSSPKVSVIVPSYNHGPFLAKRLDSILGQTFGDFELIFLDDASTDNSLEIFEGYSSDPRIRVSNNDENTGSPFKQWNKGFDFAVGEFIWIAETDDYCEPGFLEKMVETLDAHPGAGLAYCNSWSVKSVRDTTELELVAKWYASFDDGERWTRDHQNSGSSELARYMAFKNTIPNASAVLFRKSILDDGLRALEEMRLTGDWLFWSNILVKADVAFIAEPLNYFRDAHSGSQRDRTKKDALELIEGLKIYSFIDHQINLDRGSKRKILRHQVRSWGEISYERRLDWTTIRSVYDKLLSAHPEVQRRKITRILIPFVYFYLTCPIRRIEVLRDTYHALRDFFRYRIGGATNRRIDARSFIDSRDPDQS